MASIWAMRSGVGITTLGLPDVLKGNLPFKIYPEIILKYFLSIDGGFHIDKNSAITLCEEFESILVGSGWGIGKERFNSLKNISELYEKTLVIDADCLNMIAKYGYYDIFSSTKASIIITPHIAEMARLCKTNNEDIIDNQEKYAHEFACKYNITVVLKSYKTIVANKNSLYVNLSPNSGLAKGGSGDLLAGLIAGLAASKIINGNVPLNSAICGVYLHSQAGLLAAEKILPEISKSGKGKRFNLHKGSRQMALSMCNHRPLFKKSRSLGSFRNGKFKTCRKHVYKSI